MNRTKLNMAVQEAYRFIQKAEALPIPVKHTFGDGQEYMDSNFPKEQGAIRRASMDLTRALADLRKP